ncbi:MAG: hypothetical protein KGJ39_01855 [Acidobacteriota bacterium]|nr:hypothetical protein [Acidobacteriota bacterium]
MRRLRLVVTPAGAFDGLVIVALIYVVLYSLHPNLLFSSSLITGGDTGAHLALPAYLRTQGNLFNLTPWYPGWFAGMPAYTYYFVLPDYFATLASYVIGFAVAFKLATVLGSVLMPIAAYAMGRLFRAPRPVPIALAAATLPFLFDASFTIDGGNLFSTMAGEYAFSLSLAFALVTIGLFARGVVTGRGYWLAAIGLTATLLAHVLPFFFVVVAAGVLVVIESLQRLGVGDPRELRVPGDLARPWRFAIGAGLLSAGLSAWWLLPFVTSQQLTNSMGYVNDSTSSVHAIFTTLGWFTSSGGAAGDRWVITMAALACVVAVIVRDRLGMVLASLTVVSFAAFTLDPQSVIWNERLVPFWFIMIHLGAGWLVGYPLSRWVNQQRHWSLRARPVVAEGAPSPASLGEGVATAADAVGADLAGPEDSAATSSAPPTPVEAEDAAPTEFVFTVSHRPAEDVAALRERRSLRASVAVAVLGLASVVPGLIPSVASAIGLTTTGNQVSGWAQWNYSGYQGKAAWPEYHDLMSTMGRVAQRYGCGRAMWEYNINENRFGTPMALMLLPYWTNNCVDSMEGLFFESSATTPYHFLDQAELSAAPSNPQVGLPYGQLNVVQGVQHLQMLGVKYYIAYSPLVIGEADGDPALRYVAETKNWPSPGVRWRIYLIRHSPVVEALPRLPNVIAHSATRIQWLNANVTWWMNPKLWPVLAAASGPASWPRAGAVTHMRVAPAPPTSVSDVVVGTQSVSFHVTRLGTPVLVKISYYPRWHASGATGPYRVSPNLMVVVPTSHDVTLSYSSTPEVLWGNVVSDATALGGAIYAWWWVRRRRASATAATKGRR